MDAAAQGGHLQVLQWLFKSCDDYDGAALKTILQSSDEIAELLLENDCIRYFDGTPKVFRALFKEAAANGHWNVIRSLCEHDKLGNDKVAMLNEAICHGHFKTVDWVHSFGMTSFGAVEEAAEAGHLDMLKYLLSKWYKHTSTKDAMDIAAANNHLDAVLWLHENRSEGCSREAMDNAAANGHLDMVKWLHENRSEGCTSFAMNSAAKNGHLAVIQWLHKNRSEGCSSDAMDQAAANGWISVVQWLHENRCEGCTQDAMDAAAGNGHLRILEFLHKHRQEGCTKRAMKDAAHNGHVQVTKWLFCNRPELLKKGKLDDNFVHGYLRASSSILSSMGRSAWPPPPKVIGEVYHYDMLEWFLQHDPDVAAGTLRQLEYHIGKN